MGLTAAARLDHAAGRGALRLLLDQLVWRRAQLVGEQPVYPRVIGVELGEFEVELYFRQAPITVTNFLRYVLEGYYRNGEFFRTVTLENQPNG